MPTYAYRCPACGREYDKLQKMSDSTPVECPECGTPGVRQISAGIGLIFKGSGFYETDYKRKGESRTKYETAKSDDSGKKEHPTAKSSDSEAASPKDTPKDKPKDVPKDKPKDKPKTGEGS